MNSKLHFALRALASTALLFGMFMMASSISSAQTTNQKVPVSILVNIPCANDGGGELVQMTGTLHISVHISTDANGCVTMKTHAQPGKLTGVGEVTGAKYQGNGVTQSITKDKTSCGDGCIIEQHLVNNFRMIGQGPGNNFQVHQNIKVTYNICTNETTTVVEQESIECF
jgi:hypothetical protein